MVGPLKHVYKRREWHLKVYRKFWSFRRRCHKGLQILPPIRDQGQNGTCLYNAICGIMEAKLRMKGVSVKLSVHYIEQNAKKNAKLLPSPSGPQERSLFTEVPMVLQHLTHFGIPTEDDYNKGCLTGARYKIRNFQSLTWFKSTTPSAIDKLRNKGPLLAVIKISKNYTSDFLSGMVYKFDSANVDKDSAQTSTHAIMSTGYAIDDTLPIWEMMNSYGNIGKEKGFGYFDFDSLVALYSIDMET